MVGDKVSIVFHMNSKRVKKLGVADYYAKYDTDRGGKGPCLYLIKSFKIKFT